MVDTKNNLLRNRCKYAEKSVYTLDPSRGEETYLGTIDDDGVVYTFDRKYGYKKYIGTVDENGIVCVTDPEFENKKFIVAV